MADKPRKTAQEKAQEALDAAERKVKGLNDRLTRAKAQVTALETDLKAAEANRDYVKQHPALTQPTEVAKPESVGDIVINQPDAPKDTLPPF